MLKVLKSQCDVHFILFLLDVATVLSVFSESLQNQESCVGDIYNGLEACKKGLQRFSEHAGPRLQSIIDEGGDKFQGLSLTASAGFEGARAKTLKNLIDSLENRFDADEDLLQATCFVDLNIWPQMDEG